MSADAGRTRASAKAQGSRAPGAPWYREPWVWFVLGIPATAVMMGALMLTLAGRGFDGLVADDYYKRGMQVNRAIERDRAAAAHGMRGTVEVDAAAGTVTVLLEGEGGFTAPPEIELAFHHATRAGLDRTVTLRLRGEDSYGGPWQALETGLWNVSLGTAEWRLVARHHSTPERAAARMALAPAPL